jgi:hypothetical protein
MQHVPLKSERYQCINLSSIDDIPRVWSSVSACCVVSPYRCEGGELGQHYIKERWHQLLQIKTAMFRCPPDENKGQGVALWPLSASWPRLTAKWTHFTTDLPTRLFAYKSTCLYIMGDLNHKHSRQDHADFASNDQ